jgi:hypothetical protein
MKYKRSKFGNKKCTYQGLKFDSKLELERWLFLKKCEAEGKIAELSRQEKFKLEVNGVKICDYIADFTYTSMLDGTLIFEDAKGVLTDVFRIKAKLFKAIYGYEIKIVKKENITTL